MERVDIEAYRKGVRCAYNPPTFGRTLICALGPILNARGENSIGLTVPIKSVCDWRNLGEKVKSLIALIGN